MKNQSSSNKTTLIIGAVIVLVAAGGWYFYSKGGSSASTSQLIASTPGSESGTASVGAQVLGILNSVSSIDIDAQFFSTPAYQSLMDYSMTVPPQSVGRQNPFAPVGGSAGSAGDATSSQ